MRTLRTLRRQVDALDARIVRLLNRRAALAIRMSIVKRHRGRRLVDPKRERRILARLARLNAGPLSTQDLHQIYREIFLRTRRVEQRSGSQ